MTKNNVCELERDLDNICCGYKIQDVLGALHEVRSAGIRSLAEKEPEYINEFKKIVQDECNEILDMLNGMQSEENESELTHDGE